MIKDKDLNNFKLPKTKNYNNKMNHFFIFVLVLEIAKIRAVRFSNKTGWYFPTSHLISGWRRKKIFVSRMKIYLTNNFL